MSVKMFDDIVDRERHGPKPALGRLSLFRTVGPRLRGSGTLKRIQGDDFGQATRYPRVTLNLFQHALGHGRHASGAVDPETSSG